MWEPEPGWTPLVGGRGVHTVGVWRGTFEGVPAILKRLGAPSGFDEPSMTDPGDLDYWRREADVLLDGALTDHAGVTPARLLSLAADETGISLVVAEVEPAENSGLFVARCLGQFAAEPLPPRPVWATNHLRTRLERVARRGGWPLLGRTTASDVADHLWLHRGSHLDALDQLPRVSVHGDPTLANLLGRAGERVVGVDWSHVGWGPPGADVGYLALSAREDFDALVAAYGEGLGASDAHIGYAARVTAVYTAFNRAEWALARVADGEGALAGKFRHPSVAPYLHALQRLIPQVEALLQQR